MSLVETIAKTDLDVNLFEHEHPTTLLEQGQFFGCNNNPCIP